MLRNLVIDFFIKHHQKNRLRGVAIFAIDFSGRPAQKISKNHATANAFGCPDSSCFARFDPTIMKMLSSPWKMKDTVREAVERGRSNF